MSVSHRAPANHSVVNDVKVLLSSLGLAVSNGRLLEFVAFRTVNFGVN